MKKHDFSIPVFLIVLLLVLTLSGCSSLGQSAGDGVREGVRDGIAGLFPGGGSSSSSGSSSGSGSSASGGTSSSAQRNYSGSAQEVEWPSDADWSRYGLSGLRQPPGTTVAGAAMYQGAYMVGLINGGQPALENLMAQIDKMAGAELMTSLNVAGGRMVGYQLSGGSVQITADFENGDISISATK